jgi:uncharacterized repeat protein (TIGR01451 family)
MKTLRSFTTHALAFALVTLGSLAPTAKALVLPTLSINSVSIAEGNAGTTNLTFTVTASPAPLGTITFDIATANGTATAGSDYVAKSLTGQIINGTGVANATYGFTVTINGDTLMERDETFFVNLANVVGATVATSQGTGTISNDDTVGVFTATLNGANESPANASPGIGSATVTYNATAHTMRVQSTFSGLTGTATASHIHGPTAVPGTGTSGVATMTPSFTGFPLGVTSGTYDSTFDMTLASSFNASFVTANGNTVAGADTALLNAIIDGKAYFNIHSSTFGGGEIRGFFSVTNTPVAPVATPTPSSQTVTNGMNTATIIFTSTVAGTTYTWTNDNTSIGIGASGSGSAIASFTVANTGASPVTAHFGVTPTANGVVGTTTNFTITVNPTISPADLALTITSAITGTTAPANSVAVGDTITYTYFLTNNGPNDATNATVTLPIPANCTFVSDVQTLGVPFTASTTGSPVTSVAFATGSFAANTSATFKLVVRVNQGVSSGVSITDNASATTTTTNPAGNDTPSKTLTTVINSDVAITITGSPTSLFAGTDMTNTITVVNNGPTAATGVIWNLTLPPGTIYLGFSSTGLWVNSVSNSAVGATLASLASGSSGTFRLITRVSTNVTPGTVITNRVTVTSTSSDSTSGNNADSALATVIRAETVSLDGATVVTVADFSSPTIVSGAASNTIVITGAVSASDLADSVQLALPVGQVVSGMSVVITNYSGPGNGNVSLTGTNSDALLNASFSGNGTLTPTVPFAQPNPFRVNINAPIFTSSTIDPISGTLFTSTTYGSASYVITLTLAPACPTITLSPASALAGGVAGVSYSQNFSASGGVTNYAFTNTAGALPSGLALSSNGALTGIPTATGTFNFTVTATDAHGCTGSSDYALTIACPTITLSPSDPLAGGTAGVSYSQSITASGGTAAYIFTLTAGSLPSGLTLSTNGTVAGIPTATDGFSFTVTATDANGCTGSSNYSMSVGCPAITLSSNSLAGGTNGVSYGQNITASGGSAPYNYSLLGGSLPDGLTLATNGVLSGIPTNSGAFNFTVLATDANGCIATLNYALTVITPGPQPVRVNIIGPGTVRPASVLASNLTIGRTYSLLAVSNSPADSFFGWSNHLTHATSLAPAYTFTMSNNLELTARFGTNPFVVAAGSYYGLFCETNGVAFRSAGWVRFIVNAHHQFSGQLWVNNDHASFSGKFDVLGNGYVARPVVTVGGATLGLQFMVNFDDTIGGTVNLGTNWISSLRANRTTPVASNLFVGSYNFIWQVPSFVPSFDATAAREIIVTTPPGYSFSSPKISGSGDVTPNGNTVFADGFSSTPRPATVSKDGEWPFFATSSPEPGGVNDFRSLGFGWLRVVPGSHTLSTATTIAGDMTWVMTPNTRHYAAGFTSTNPVTGCQFTAPTRGQSSAATLTVSTLDSADPLLGYLRTFPATFINSTFNVTAPGASVRASYTTSNGRLSGRFSYSTPASVDYFYLNFQGVYLPDYDFIGGIFQNQNGVGLFQADVPKTEK